MPPQLKAGLERRRRRPRHLPPRLLLESLQALDSRWLARKGMFPPDWFHRNVYNHFGFVCTATRSLILDRAKATVVHLNGQQQIIPIRWLNAIRYIGRPTFVCRCKRNAFKLFCVNGAFICKRCCGGRYASQTRNSAARAQLQASRLRNALRGYPGPNTGIPKRPATMARYVYNILVDRLRQYDAKASRGRNNLITRRINERVTRPLINYNTVSIGER